uniref:Uncharacterized protein n=1 Tax=Ditylenchus dipsaci TaxID=166011 RepID=A0A915E8B0_9BILA
MFDQYSLLCWLSSKSCACVSCLIILFDRSMGKIKCEPKHKIRRLDSIPGASKNPTKLTSNTFKGMQSCAEPGFSQTVVHFHQPAVLYL